MPAALILNLTFKPYPDIRFAGLMLVIGAALIKQRNGHLCDVGNIREYVDPRCTRAEIAKTIATRALDISSHHHATA